MATGMKKCKVCGKEYEACHTQAFAAGIFRWQDVACCPEHGAEYLAAVTAARAKASDAGTAVAEPEAAVEPAAKSTSQKRSKKR